MKKVKLTETELLLANKYNKYFNGIVSVYPSFMTSFLKKSNNEYFFKKIQEGAALSEEEIMNLSNLYKKELESYKENAYKVAELLGVPAHNFFLDSIGTDVMETIYNLQEEHFSKFDKESSQMSPDEAKNFNVMQMMPYVKMDLREIDEYRQKSLDELIK